MITRLSHTTVYVLDQERARAFYVEKLGFEIRDDVRMGDFRWLTVAPPTQPDACLVLMAIAPSPMIDADTVGQLRALVEKGVLGAGAFEVDDCQRTYDELVARGVEFREPPKQMPYGKSAVFRDDSGNYFAMTERN